MWLGCGQVHVRGLAAAGFIALDEQPLIRDGTVVKIIPVVGCTIFKEAGAPGDFAVYPVPEARRINGREVDRGEVAQLREPAQMRVVDHHKFMIGRKPVVVVVHLGALSLPVAGLTT